LSNFYYPAHHNKLRDYLLEYNRLYAYPNIPTVTNEHKIILDSGAFHMYKAKKPVTIEYADKLLEHYEQFKTYSNIYCICADTPKNPYKTKKLLEYMLKENPLVCPVLHNPSDKGFDAFSIKKQIENYSELCSDRFIAMSRSKLDINSDKALNTLKFITKIVKKYFKHFHIFGAGYNHNEVLRWRKTGCDSIDSISYYTDAEYGESWDFNYDGSGDFIPLSLANLMEANRV
jgi:hypothetical protein